MLTQVFKSQSAKGEADVAAGLGGSHGIQHQIESVCEAGHYIVPAAAWRLTAAHPCHFPGCFSKTLCALRWLSS